MQKGFTLIELLVVVLIIGILSAVALPQYESAMERSRSTEALTNGRTLVDSMNRALTERPNESPNHKGALDVKIGGGSWNENGTLYTTTNFTYDISTGEYVLITRDLGDGEYYKLYMYNSDGGDKLECTHAGEDGEKMCKTMQAQGFEMVNNSGSEEGD